HVLDLGAKLLVRTGLDALARGGRLRGAVARLRGTALRGAQGRREHGLDGRAVLRVAAQDVARRDLENADRAVGLKLRQPLVQDLGRCRRLLTELLCDALDVALERLELVLQLELADREILRLFVAQAAATPRLRLRPIRGLTQRGAQVFGLLALRLVGLRGTLGDIAECLLDRGLPLGRGLLERRLQLFRGTARLGRVHVALLVRTLHGLERLRQALDRLLDAA